MSKASRNIPYTPEQWSNSAAIRMCSLEARGLFMELICIAMASSKPGTLVSVDEKPLSLGQISRASGAEPEVVDGCISELVSVGLVQKSPEGILSLPCVEKAVKVSAGAARRMAAMRKNKRLASIVTPQLRACYGDVTPTPSNANKATPGVGTDLANISTNNNIYNNIYNNNNIILEDNIPIEVRTNVYLSRKDRGSLRGDLSEKELEYWLTELESVAVQNPTGWKKRYKNHARVIRQWRRRKLEEGKTWDEAAGLYLKPQNLTARPLVNYEALRNEQIEAAKRSFKDDLYRRSHLEEK